MEINSKRTRVQPVFSWLRDHANREWPNRLLRMASGLAMQTDCGQLQWVDLDRERTVPASPARLAWMLQHAEALAPRDGARFHVFLNRIVENPDRMAALQILDSGTTTGVPRCLRLEGPSHADCLIECERAIIWVEGKRFDWLTPGTTWDVTRDQLARNLEAVWLLAQKSRKDYCLLICHEYPLKHHERQLVEGYRNNTWSAGWPHFPPEQRLKFSKRIGTLTWAAIATQWPELQSLALLKSLAV